MDERAARMGTRPRNAWKSSGAEEIEWAEGSRADGRDMEGMYDSVRVAGAAWPADTANVGRHRYSGALECAVGVYVRIE